MILIDNYDSFTYNVVQYLLELGVEPKIFKNDEISVEELAGMDFNSIIISPGPKNPDSAGISLDVIKRFYKTKKVLGICLGHQCLAQFFGACVVQSQNPVHGKTSRIFFEDNSLFVGLNQGFEATRYHSLIVSDEKFPSELKIIAKTKADEIMAICHEKYPLFGVQFHPEAILTQDGKRLLSNFLCLDYN